MTINPNDTSGTPVTPAPVTPAQALPATVTAYEGLVTNLNSALDALAAQIPELQAPHASTSPFVRTHLNVPLEFISTALSAVSDSPVLQASNTLKVEQVREALQFIDAFQTLHDKVSLFADNLKFTINERQAQVSVQAQMLYGVAKQVARNPENAVVTGHVKLMKGHLIKAKRSRTKAPAPGAGTVTTPVTTTAPAPVAQPHITSQEATAVSKQ